MPTTLTPCDAIKSLYAAYLQITAHNAEAAATLTLANVITCCVLSVAVMVPQSPAAAAADADDAADDDDTVLTDDAKAAE